MTNELRIKPLLEYELEMLYADGVLHDKFTAESHTYDTVSDTVKFMRTGNVIREYSLRGHPYKIVATPVDNEVSE